MSETAAGKSRGDISIEFSVTDYTGKRVFEKNLEVEFARLGPGGAAVKQQRLAGALAPYYAKYLAAIIKAAIASAVRKG